MMAAPAARGAELLVPLLRTVLAHPSLAWLVAKSLAADRVCSATATSLTFLPLEIQGDRVYRYTSIKAMGMNSIKMV